MDNFQIFSLCWVPTLRVEHFPLLYLYNSLGLKFGQILHLLIIFPPTTWNLWKFSQKIPIFTSVSMQSLWFIRPVPNPPPTGKIKSTRAQTNHENFRMLHSCIKLVKWREKCKNISFPLRFLYVNLKVSQTCKF